MSGGSVHPHYDAVHAMLKKLRLGPGLQDTRRLRRDKNLPHTILDLPVVRQIARHRSEELAALEAIALCLGQLDNALQLAGAVALAVDAASPAARDLLVLPQVGQRRKALCDRWTEFMSTDGPRNVDHLRRAFENAAIDQLAAALVSSTAHSLGVDAPAGFAGRRGGRRLLVVGGIVNDIIFKITDFPEHETSNEASSCRTTPGGKGFMQAVAAARLGLDVTLLAAIGKDQDRALVQEQLTSNGVDVSHLSVINDENGSTTGIFERPRSDSQAVNFRGPAALTTRDIDEVAPTLGNYDAVLATFEVPQQVMAHLLAALSNLHGRRPIVIITPAQPYSNKKLDRLLLKSADYLVARRWEFLRLFPDGHPHANDDLYENLLDLDVGHVCLMNDDGSTLYSNTGVEARKSPYVLPGATNLPSSAISRDAFCASLAWHLIEHPHVEVSQAVMWAAAAMALAATNYASRVAADDDPYATLNSLPNREEVAKRASREPRYQIAPAQR